MSGSGTALCSSSFFCKKCSFLFGWYVFNFLLGWLIEWGISLVCQSVSQMFSWLVGFVN